MVSRLHVLLGHQKVKHRRKEEEAKRLRRSATFPTSRQYKDALRLTTVSTHLSSDAAWKTKPGIVRHHDDPFVAVSVLTGFLDGPQV